MTNHTFTKKFVLHLVSVIALALCLTLTSTALVYTSVADENELFTEEFVKIDLNGGESVISEKNKKFEPGMTVVKDFYVRNESNCDVYYKLYFSDIEGELRDVLEITIYDGSLVLYNGTADDLIRAKSKPVIQALTPGEKRDLQISFYYPQFADNETAGKELKFSFCADAVQAEGNPDRLF